ncbi:Acetyl-coenzyme A synthetase 2-like, mitochondrial [Geodia barretti]|uniref:acetate--CoA ligase n=1 Tax=Geodia barretti TaxID=519541 RepID=A0AA35WZ08_GEOBA|nr:Acetyl-coenzyme A synthetase 2-like, mitochondrial [Geodia barretti]
MVDINFIYRIPNLVINSPPLHMDSKSDTVDYEAMYDESIKNPTEFWSRQAKKFLKWIKIFDEVDGCRLEEGVISWFTGGQLNVSYNCLDRHAVKNGERTALIWENNRTKEQINGIHECISYRKLLEMTCQIANVLRTNCGIKKGDRIVIYMPTCPLAVAAMLACARIGAVHCVLYSVLGVRDIMKRIKSSEAKVVVTAQKAFVGDKCLHLRSNIDKTLKLLEKTNENSVNHVLVWKMNDCDIGDTLRDTDLETAMKAAPTYCEPVAMESEDPLFIMYTSGTTDEPTGILHTQAGYLLCAAMTHKYVFDYKIGEVFACVADLGWIAAHTSVVYGPLCNGGTTVLFQGTATYPDSGRYWEMVERLKVNHFYTSPAAIKKLMKDNLNCVNDYNVSSLKTIALELGGFALSPWPGSKLKPGVCAKPFLGVEPIIVNEKGEILQESGVQGKYFTGDWAYRDMDGDYQIVGRKDDIVRIKGVWIQIPEIESSIVGKSNNIENASYIGLSSEPSATTDACVVVEVRKSVPESQQKCKKFYRDILESVKSSIINIAGEHALPRFVLVVRESVYTWSNKMCRSIYRDMAEGFFKPLLKHVDPSENIVLLDYTTSPLPPVANKWEHLQ